MYVCVHIYIYIYIYICGCGRIAPASRSATCSTRSPSRRLAWLGCSRVCIATAYGKAVGSSGALETVGGAVSGRGRWLWRAACRKRQGTDFLPASAKHNALREHHGLLTADPQSENSEVRPTSMLRLSSLCVSGSHPSCTRSALDQPPRIRDFSRAWKTAVLGFSLKQVLIFAGVDFPLDKD